MNIPTLLQFEVWQLVLLVSIPVGVSALLYTKDTEIPPRIRWSLAIFRFLSIALLLLLLFQWKWFAQKSMLVKPSLVFVIDDSQSLKQDSAVVANFILNDVKDLEKAGYQVDLVNLANERVKPEEVSFNRSETPLLSSIDKIIRGYQPEDYLVGLVSLSDGIITSGSASPSSVSSNVAIHSVGLGDTTARTDLRVISLVANRTALLGNTFEISGQVAAEGFANKSVEILLKKEGKVVQKKTWYITNRTDYLRVSFFENATEKGYSSYQLEVLAPKEDKVIQNNVKSTVVEIIEKKKKVLLLANSPHPDIRMFEAMMESIGQYELITHTLSISTNSSDLTKVLDDSYEWVIAHQIPSSFHVSVETVGSLIRKKVPILFVIGAQTSLTQLNRMQEALQISMASSRADRVRGSFGVGSEFVLNDAEMSDMLPSFPAVVAPYGSYQAAPSTQVILEQVVGTTQTNKPLLCINTSSESESPMAFFVGDGLWQWRMASFQEKNDFTTFDLFWSKLFQLLENKRERNQLVVVPLKDTFGKGEPVELKVETFNLFNEAIGNQVVTIEITNKRNFKKVFEVISEVPAITSKQSGFEEGIYTYRAFTTLNGKKVETSGYFEVSSQNAELELQEANHDLLRTIDVNSGGQFVTKENIDVLKDHLMSNLPVTKVITTEAWSDTIDLYIIFFFVLVCLTLEWGIRKYIGK